MPKPSNFWIVPSGEQWLVRGEATTQVISVHAEREEAWAEGRRRARGVGGEAILQGRDGKIRTRNTYATDRRPIKD